LRNGFFRQVEENFSSFFAKVFAIFDDFFNAECIPKVLQNFEKSSNMPKIGNI